MIANDQKPKVLFRYQDPQDKQEFETFFKQNFSILLAHSDQQAIDYLRHTDAICGLFIDYPEVQLLSQSELATYILKEVSDIPVFLFGDNLSIDILPNLLKDQLISKCYDKPYDANLIRSDVFAASIKRRNSFLTKVHSSSHTAQIQDPTDFYPGVLIVDDEVLATKYLVKQLKHRNNALRLYVSENAQDAWNLLTDPNNNIGVIISDQKMAGMKGDELLKKTRQSFPHIIRILTSAYREVDVALGAINEGQIYQYLKKPWIADDIYELIVEALNHFQQQSRLEKHHQDSLSVEFKILIKQRIHHLQSAIQQDIQRLTHRNTLNDYLDFLKLLDQPPSSRTVIQSSIRASQETDLETSLINAFQEKVTQCLFQLEHFKKLDESIQKTTLNSIINALQSPSQDVKVTSAFDIPEVAHKIHQLTIDSIDILLLSSNLERDALTFEHTSNGIFASNKTDSPIKVYKHLLSPISNLSRTLIEHQKALLFLFLLKDTLNLTMQFKAGHGEFHVSCQFAKTLDSNRVTQ